MSKSEFVRKLNAWGREKTPFLFVVDFELEHSFASPLNKIDPCKILYDFRGFTNSPNEAGIQNLILSKYPIPERAYQKQFDEVMHHLNRGDSFVTNLTIKTEIRTDASLRSMRSGPTRCAA